MYFQGVHHYSLVWLNGMQLGPRHINGYTSFSFRLDGNGAKFGEGNANVNVLAIFANSAPGSGMYGYHGGGLTRHQFLVHTTTLFMPPEELWVHTLFGNSTVVAPAGHSHADGLKAVGTEIIVKGIVSNAATQPMQDVWVVAEVIDQATQAVVATQAAGPLTVSANATQDFEIHAHPPNAVQLWSVARPALHTARVAVHTGATATSPATDAENITFGVRSIAFDPDKGMFLNQQHVKLRGECTYVLAPITIQSPTHDFAMCA